ncbi:MAG: hypothetical protein HPKKFMNG_00693 [Planctomycetes bacterium]|nr:hypothetical protein [Planctomycetota bacterium]HRJ78259.1 hypothetical protein [Planctomycetota bacterium]
MKYVYIIMLLFLVGVTVYGVWARERPRQQGRITGDFKAAGDVAGEQGSRLFLAVDRNPGY